MGTGYSIHISHSPSVKAGRHRLSHGPAFCEYVIGATADFKSR